MALRVATAAVGLPVLAAIVWAGGTWFTLLGMTVALLGTREFLGLARAGGVRTQGPLPYVLVVVVLLLAARSHQQTHLVAGLVVTVAAAVLWATLTWDGQAGDASWLWTVGAVLYLPLLLSHYLWMRDWPDGQAWVALALAGTFATDTGAYLIGKGIGRHKMAPRTSPGKTWEGAVGGLAGGALGTWAAATAGGLAGGAAFAVLGIGLSVAAQSGDLAESYLKRNARVKDAGGIVPGHGGLLDRLDSLVFAGPFVYYYAVWAMGAGTP